jgi:hypothetical protein
MSTINLTFNPRDRLQQSMAIEALINLLDEIDCDENLEDNGDTEPNGDELVYNGDELVCSVCEDEMAPLDERDPCARPAARQVLRWLREITASV